LLTGYTVTRKLSGVFVRFFVPLHWALVPSTAFEFYQYHPDRKRAGISISRALATPAKFCGMLKI
jgi:hypothetical protein